MPSLESNVHASVVPPPGRDDRPLALALLRSWHWARFHGDYDRARAVLARLEDLARRRSSPAWYWVDTD
ncbi:MAG: hypothetical protein JO161_02515 [Planctomycetaceae bacterium]|nr:hypothetical protein [Planctomycetaceae bacterium]